MQLDTIKKMIVEAQQIEERTGLLADCLRKLALMNGVQLSEAQMQGVLEFVYGYIQSVPYFMEEGLKAAKKAGMKEEMESVLDAAERYWLEPFDVIPDQYGMLGILDDAYFSLCLIQKVGNHCEEESGNPLLAVDLTPANTMVRGMIGEPHASTLDTLVANALGAAPMMQLMQQVAGLMGTYGTLSMDTPHPMWGNASVDEIVNVQMGAMGIV